MTRSAATYRIQLHGAGGLHGAAELVPYLRRLGVTTLYLSPIFHARSGSEHGYDVVDPGRIDPSLGGRSGFEKLISACRRHDLGLLLDIVPNHMAASHENPWWRSVLEHGPASPHADYFDIRWDEPVGPARGKVVLPILGRRYPEVLADGDLEVERDGDGGFAVHYFEHRLPVDPGTWPLLFEDDRELPRPLDRLLREAAELVPAAVSAEPGARAERVEAARKLRARLEELDEPGSPTSQRVDAALERLGRAGTEAPARRALDRLLSNQRYWLVHWRTATEELNYRRFFNITDLAALRMDRDEVFRAWHELLGGLLEDPVVTGVRVDHVDGLRDPGAYLARLRSLAADPNRPDGEEPEVVVEKILGPDERLPDSWPVEGTTGYDFLPALDGILVSRDGTERLRETYRTFTESAAGFGSVARRTRLRVVRIHFRRDVRRLVEKVLPLVRAHPAGRDLASSEVHGALLEVTVQLPVYRTYVTGPEPEPRDRRYLEAALAGARKQRPELPAAAFDVLEDLLLLEADDIDSLPFVERWQELTGALMAKGVEDTAFYVHNPLISLNEVGGEPDATPRSVAAFHRFNRRRHEESPRSMSATSTHDTKRSEDVRARIHVLSELADEWGERVERWRKLNRSHRRSVSGRTVPTPNEEWLIYQTLVGAWPLDGDRVPEFRERLEAFLRKAAREAKTHTSWTDPRPAHEEALLGFAREILEPDRERFVDDLREFCDRIAFHGAVNSLSQVLLKIASPGVPDIYQGTELWRFSLVDPDNRRPVDFAARSQRLRELEASVDPVRLLERWRDGGVKLLLTARTLDARRLDPDLFVGGDYLPLEAEGPRERHVVAFARRRDTGWALAVAPRLPAKLTRPGTFPLGEETWSTTRIPLPDDAPGTWKDAVTGATLATEGEDGGGILSVARVLERFPVALLRGET